MDNKKYIDWKSWNSNNFGLVKPGSKFYFDRLFTPKLKGARKILEVGFGNGELMGYFHAHNHFVVGVEINEALVDRANAFGCKAYAGNVWDVAELQSERFDLISAISVVEHMSFEELSAFFYWVGKHLSSDGKLYVVFPEGASPFGLSNQNGDFTHVTSVTKPKIEVLCNLSSMKLISYYDEPLFSNKLCSLGLFGRVTLLTLQSYNYVIKKLILIFLKPLAPGLRLGVNSVAVISLR
jgi:hypothetical protein